MWQNHQVLRSRLCEKRVVVLQERLATRDFILSTNAITQARTNDSATTPVGAVKKSEILGRALAELCLVVSIKILELDGDLKCANAH